jgi:2-oxoglutarate dehydrogenase E1 component
MNNPTFATRWNADLIDQKYAQWQDAPAELEPQWQAFFEGFELGMNGQADSSKYVLADSLGAEAGITDRAIKQSRFTGVIYAYRVIGHTQARINPLSLEAPRNPRMDLDRLGFTDTDLNERYWTGNYLEGVTLSVRELFEGLKKTYCGSIGVEYLHIQETRKRRWLQARMEPTFNQPNYSVDRKKRILKKIVGAEQFERFLHTNYVGQKRFGLEGGETMIAALDAVVENGPELGIREIVMGMAHRGRLNVLANTMGKSYEYIFNEFSENFIPDMKHGDGDVKYHLGYDADVRNSKGQDVIIRLAANPSHLEAVNPVVEGRARARQRMLEDTEERKSVLPVLIHGDAAFAGQGVVAEVLNFSQLPGYRTGGTLHFVINNQIGFTTDPSEARSSMYCTDVAKIIEAPIFHVNGDDPEAVVWVTDLALAYRQEFGCDVVIDMYCYRRHGHNESDEPAFTQPTLYRKISEHPPVAKIYSSKLIKEGIITSQQYNKLMEEHKDCLTRSYDEMRRKEEAGEPIIRPIEGSTGMYQPAYAFDDIQTNVEEHMLEHVARSLTTVPAEFNINSKIKRQLETKFKNYQEGDGIDWAFGESLAWGTLMMEGFHVRLSGQDCARGTFSQRHAVFYDSASREKHIPLMHMEGRKGMLCVHNSLLSEVAVLGFDYGYSLDYPEMLCMWEAQFGDFVNGAQVIIDQFITSSESKWQRVSGLVMLLPHGYEGQGPEHSSAKLERFLQLCAEDNIQVANLTTPAQYFHILRRQMHRKFRKPLVIMSPKSLLRHKEAVSSVKDFTDSIFQSILPDPEHKGKCDRVILCTGKVYYDLLSYRRENELKNTRLVRIEQLYPFNTKLLQAEMKNWKGCKKVVWCQEEPRNMGAWTFINPLLTETIGGPLLYAGRKAAASPAVGSLAKHKTEQAALVEQAFTL